MPETTISSLDALIRQMSLCRQDADRELRAKISEIIAICEPYRNKGYAFSFTMSGDLDKDVNRILIQLSDFLLEIYAQRARSLSEDNSDALAYAQGERHGMTAQERMDKQMSRLKYVLEGWIAISFVNNLDKDTLLERIMKYLNQPFGMEDWYDALHDKRYSATILADGDLNRKPGVQGSIVASVSLIGEGMVNDTNAYSSVQNIASKGVMRYGVMRGSTFDCPICDEVCAQTYPVTEIVVPVHPRCMCIVYPVYDSK